jgi:hypothetical protein
LSSQMQFLITYFLIEIALKSSRQGAQLGPNNSVNRTQIPLRGLCAGYLGR